MCRSVPQIAVFSSLIRTSFGPGTGTGTSSIQIPLPASRFTSAFMVCAIGFASPGRPRIIRVDPRGPVTTPRPASGCGDGVIQRIEVLAAGDVDRHSAGNPDQFAGAG